MNTYLQVVSIACLLIIGCPLFVNANVGVPIAPLIGVEMGLYLPLVILIECVILKKRWRISWTSAGKYSILWNFLTTLIGFPLVLAGLFGMMMVLWERVPESIIILFQLYWAFPFEKSFAPREWMYFLMSASLLWTVIAFLLSTVLENWFARRTKALKELSRKQIHDGIILANIGSYLPLWIFAVLQYLPSFQD